MTLQEYLDSIHGKTVAVVGIGVSNTPLIRLLLREGIAVTACEKRTSWPVSWSRAAHVCSLARTIWRDWIRISFSARRVCGPMCPSWQRLWLAAVC